MPAWRSIRRRTISDPTAMRAALQLWEVPTRQQVSTNRRPNPAARNAVYRLSSLLATARRPTNAGAFLLDRRARDRAIGTKNAANTPPGPQHLTPSPSGEEADARLELQRLGGCGDAV